MIKWFLKNPIDLPMSYDCLYCATIFFLLRDGYASNFESICKAFGIEDPTQKIYTNITGYIRYKLDLLRNAGLIEFDSSEPERSSIKVTGKWGEIQSVLDINLKEIAKLTCGKSLVISPIFGLPKELKKIPDVLVLMPFSLDLQPVYDDHISKVAESLGLSIARADDFFESDSIVSDIWALIFSSRIIIADCTGRNPNVFYELGVAHSIGKKVILIAQNDNDVPFDIKHLRYLRYEYTPRGILHFEESLKNILKQESS